MNMRMRMRAVSCLSLAVLAGSAMGQSTFTGASPIDGAWSRAANWAGGQPAAGGAANLTLSVNVPAGNQNFMAQDRGNPMVLNQLSYLNGSRDTDLGDAAVAANNRALRLSNNAAVDPRIVHDSNGAYHTINTPIELNNLRGGGNISTFIVGAAAAAGGFNPTLFVEGAISNAPGAGPQKLAIAVADPGRVSLGVASTYTGGTDLGSGTLVLRNNASLGTGRLALGVIPGRSITLVGDVSNIAAPNPNAADQYRNRDVANEVRLETTAAFGEQRQELTRLRLNGAFVVANGVRMELKGGASHKLVVGGAVSHAAGNSWVITGDAAPAVRGNFAAVNGVAKKDIQSEVTFTGASPDYRGKTTIESTAVTLDRGASWGTRMNTVDDITVGDANTNAVLRGSGGIFLGAGKKITVTKKAAVKPGKSPGVFTVDGGGVEFLGGSALEIDLDGTEAGFDPGTHAQLRLVDSTIALTPDTATGELPRLDVEPLAFAQLVGQEYTIVKMDSDALVALPGAGSPGNLFADWTGATLTNLATFTQYGVTYQIVYNHTPGAWVNPVDGLTYGSSGDELSNDGNDIVLRVVAVPAPGAACALALGAIGALRRRRA
jgi:autotransporter-associated beta strand protein